MISRIHLILPKAYKIMCFDKNINGNRDVKFLECDYLLVQQCVKLTLLCLILSVFSCLKLLRSFLQVFIILGIHNFGNRIGSETRDEPRALKTGRFCIQLQLALNVSSLLHFFTLLHIIMGCFALNALGLGLCFVTSLRTRPAAPV
jgi:hypothetical protein